MPTVITRSLACTLFFVLLCAGCRNSDTHTSNPRLRQIDEILNQQLPPGTTMSRVEFFLSSRGYETEPASNPHTIVAVIEHVDIKTLQPSAARVTFHFDSSDKLLTYDMVALSTGAGR